MITLPNTKYGTKQKAIIGGWNFNVLYEYMEIQFYVQLIDSSGKSLDDKSINQNRLVSHTLNNQKNVDIDFNYVPTGGKGEYTYFLELMQTIPLPTLILKLAAKLKERGVFD